MTLRDDSCDLNVARCHPDEKITLIREEFLNRRLKGLILYGGLAAGPISDSGQQLQCVTAGAWIPLHCTALCWFHWMFLDLSFFQSMQRCVSASAVLIMTKEPKTRQQQQNQTLSSASCSRRRCRLLLPLLWHCQDSNQQNMKEKRNSTSPKSLSFTNIISSRCAGY